MNKKDPPESRDELVRRCLPHLALATPPLFWGILIRISIFDGDGRGPGTKFPSRIRPVALVFPFFLCPVLQGKFIKGVLSFVTDWDYNARRALAGDC